MVFHRQTMLGHLGSESGSWLHLKYQGLSHRTSCPDLTRLGEFRLHFQFSAYLTAKQNKINEELIDVTFWITLLESGNFINEMPE